MNRLLPIILSLFLGGTALGQQSDPPSLDLDVGPAIAEDVRRCRDESLNSTRDCLIAEEFDLPDEEPLSNVVKTKDDTAKAAIRNIRQ